MTLMIVVCCGLVRLDTQVRTKRPLLVGLFLVLFLLLYHWPENDYHVRHMRTTQTL